MMIALDNWRWMPVRQASRLTERQDKEEIDDMRFLVRTQFGKRLLLLPCVEAFEIIPPEKDEEEWFTEKGVSRGPTNMAGCWRVLDPFYSRPTQFAQDLMSEITPTKRIQYSEYERLFEYYALLRGNITEAKKANLMEALLTQANIALGPPGEVCPTLPCRRIFGVRGRP
jgi:hypothetical protein